MEEIKQLTNKLKSFIEKHDGVLAFSFLAVVAVVYLGSTLFFQEKFSILQNIKTKLEEKKEPPHFAINVFSDEKTVASPFTMPEIQQPQFSDNVCSITSYGAVSDGKTLNTRAFSDAISDCREKGGGIVEVPEGTWLTGAIKLADNINLHLDKNSTIVFSNKLEDYLPAVFSRYEGIEYIGYSPFIYGENCKDVAITGEGKLDGQGQLWWKKNNMTATYSLYEMAKNDVPVSSRNFASKDKLLRPSFVQFTNCNSVLLENFTIQNSPMWTIHPLYSSNIIIRNLTVNTLGLNTDGIAIDSSRNVLVENSTITSGDDAIVIKSGRDRDGLRVNRPSENIVLRNCHVLEGHAGFSFGSETSGGINNVFIYNNEIARANFGLRIKSSIGRGGIVENIWAQNIKANHINQSAIQITSNYDVRYNKDYIAFPTIRNIFIDNFALEKANENSIDLVGLKENPLENISLKNITSSSKNGVGVSYAKNVILEKLNITSKGTNPLFAFSNSENITLNDSECQLNLPYCLEIKDENTDGIILKNNNILPGRIIFENGATKDAVTIE